MDGDTVSVERTIAAPPEAVFAVVADAARHSEIDGSGTVRGTRGGGEPLALGSTFGMSMKMGLPYSMKNTVIEFEPGRRIAWQTVGPGLVGRVVGGRIWRYELTPVGDGTLVRETWDLSRDKQAAMIKRSSMPASTRRAMERTLERLERAVTG